MFVNGNLDLHFFHGQMILRFFFIAFNCGRNFVKIRLRIADISKMRNITLTMTLIYDVMVFPEIFT